MRVHLRAAVLASITAAAALAACKGGADETKLPPGFTRLPADARVALPEGGDARCQPSSIRVVFRDRKSWDDYWAGQHEGCSVPALPAAIDWGKEMVAFANMGKRPDGADTITIIGHGVVHDTAVVLVRRATLQPGCTIPPGVHYPRAAARIPADTRPVRFLEERRKPTC